jgi:hypothetical protein
MANTSVAGGLNLSSIAAGAHGETRRRVRGSNAAMNSAMATELAERQGYFKSNEEEQGRTHSAQATQQALDIALARREQAMREARAHAAARYSQQQRARDDQLRAAQEAREKSDWFDQQRFQTDENIRQQQAIMEMQARLQPQDDGTPKLSDFGGRAISAQRGALLAEQAPDRFKPTDNEVGFIEDAYAEFGDNPLAMEAFLREKFGNRTRTASRALYETYGIGMGG